MYILYHATLAGQSFIIDKEGALLGRKVSNTIPLLMKVRAAQHIYLYFSMVSVCMLPDFYVPRQSFVLVWRAT